jgi:hypothetical protein
MEELHAASLTAPHACAADALIAGCYLAGTNTRRVRTVVLVRLCGSFSMAVALRSSRFLRK